MCNLSSEIPSRQAGKQNENPNNEKTGKPKTSAQNEKKEQDI